LYFNRYAAVVEELHILPCMLPKDVPDAALDELATYRRVKARLERQALNVCPRCMKRREQELKTCSVCGAKYNDAGDWEPPEGEQQ